MCLKESWSTVWLAIFPQDKSATKYWQRWRHPDPISPSPGFVSFKLQHNLAGKTMHGHCLINMSTSVWFFFSLRVRPRGLKASTHFKCHTKHIWRETNGFFLFPNCLLTIMSWNHNFLNTSCLLPLAGKKLELPVQGAEFWHLLDKY